MEVRFYNFSKRNNSTKIPTGGYKSFNCLIKESSSIVNPKLKIQTDVIAAYNYAYIPQWNRYYFVNDAVSEDNMWIVYLEEDSLATYKDAIGNTSCNIMYASGSTKNIVDSRIPVRADVTISEDSNSIAGLEIFDQGGNTVIGITGKGSFGAYVCNDINDLLDGVDNWWDNLTINNVWDAAKQFIFGGSAADCIKSAIKLPIQWTELIGPTENLYLGNYPAKNDNGVAIQGIRILQPIVSGTCNCLIPWPATKNWTRLSQYSTIVMYLPLIGLVNLPATELQDETNINIQYKVNITSGDLSVIYTGGTTRKHLGTASANIAQNTAYGSTGINTNKMTQSVVTGVGSLIVGVALAAESGGLSLAQKLAVGGGLAASAGQAISAMGGSSDGSGGLGGGASNALDKDVHIWVVTKNLTDTPNSFNPIMGKPYMSVGKPKNFSGYVQTDGFKFEHIQAFKSEKEIVNTLMDSGIYFE